MVRGVSNQRFRGHLRIAAAAPLNLGVVKPKEQRMSKLPSTSAWKPIDLSALRSTELTTSGYELSRSQWPDWATEPPFRRIAAFSGSPHGSTSSSVIASLLTERLDPEDYPKEFNYNLYLIAETTDGKLFQSPPIIPSDPKHHSSSPSTWFNNLGSPLGT